MPDEKEEVEKWTFFCKEIAKANDILDGIELTWKHINLNNNAYNPFFSLLIDSLTTKIFLTLGHIFDNQSNSLSLLRIISSKEQIANINKLKKEAEPFILARHKQHAHLSRISGELNYQSNFRLMNDFNATKIREILDEVSAILRRWGVENNNGGVIADRWGNIGTSAELLFEHLEEYEYIRSKMSTYEHVEIVENIKKKKQGSLKDI